MKFNNTYKISYSALSPHITRIIFRTEKKYTVKRIGSSNRVVNKVRT